MEQKLPIYSASLSPIDWVTLVVCFLMPWNFDTGIIVSKGCIWYIALYHGWHQMGEGAFDQDEMHYNMLYCGVNSDSKD